MITFLSFVLSLTAWASTPQGVVEDIFQRASQPEIASDQTKQSEVNAFVDFDALAKSALGKQGKGVPAAEYAWFRDTLQEIITRTVYPKAPDFLKGVKISYDKVQEKGAKATVISSVQNKADLTDVQYTMAKDGEKWRVVDVSISGLSWVDSIHDQVAEVLKKKKWKGLKEALNKRLAELKTGTAP